MNAKELAAYMGDNAPTIVEYLLPQGKKVGKEWKVGGVGGEAGASMSVCLSGSKRGVWKDFATGDAGDLLSLWCQCRMVSVPEAMRDAKRFLGVQDTEPVRQMPSYKRPEKPKCSSPKAAVNEWLSARGLEQSTIAAFKVAEAERNGKTYAVFPYLREGELINAKTRNISDKKDMRQEAGAEPCLFGWHLIDPKTRSVAITEGEIDAMTLHQIGIPAMSANQGAGAHQWIDNDWSRLDRFSEIFICYDSDEAGQRGAKEIVKRLGVDRCRIVTFPEKDANDYLQTGATADDFRKAFSSAKSLDPEELRAIDSFFEGVKALFYPDENRSSNPFLSFCDEKQFWFDFRQGELTVWTGYNGHGKSLLLNQVLIGIMDQGEKVCVFSGEMTPERQGQRIVKQLAGLARPSPSYIDAIGAWLRDRMWLFNLTGTASIDRLIEVFTYGFKRYGIRHFVIDSLMMTDVPEDGGGAMTAQKEAMRKLAGFARGSGVHVHLVAHPRKGADEKKAPGKLDVAGSSKLTDAADNVFTVWSAQKEEGQQDDEPDAILELWKNRNGEDQHRRLALYFNRQAMQFGLRKNRRPFTHIPFTTSQTEEV